MTAAGIEVAKVSPTFSPKYTFAAVNSSVMTPPSRTPRMVSSAGARATVAVMPPPEAGECRENGGRL